MPPAAQSHAKTVCPPPHTVLHGWRAPERQRNGDLVVPLVRADGETHGLRATATAWREFAHAILAALISPAASGASRQVGAGLAKARSDRERAQRGEPLRKPNGRL